MRRSSRNGQRLAARHIADATFLIKQSGSKRSDAYTGAVTLVQGFGSAANLNIHLRCLVLDGVYRRSEHGQVFEAAPGPSIEALQALLAKIIVRLMRRLTRPGLLIEEQGKRYLAGIEAQLRRAVGRQGAIRPRPGQGH